MSEISLGKGAEERPEKERVQSVCCEAFEVCGGASDRPVDVIS